MQLTLAPYVSVTRLCSNPGTPYLLTVLDTLPH